MPLSTSTHLQINPTTVVKFFPKFQKQNKTFSLDDFCLQVGQSSLLLPPSQINMEIMSECGREQLGHELEELDLGEGKVSWCFVATFKLRAFLNYHCRPNGGFCTCRGCCWGIEKSKEFGGDLGRLQRALR